MTAVTDLPNTLACDDISLVAVSEGTAGRSDRSRSDPVLVDRRSRNAPKLGTHHFVNERAVDDHYRLRPGTKTEGR